MRIDSEDHRTVCVLPHRRPDVFIDQLLLHNNSIRQNEQEIEKIH